MRNTGNEIIYNACKNYGEIMFMREIEREKTERRTRFDRFICRHHRCSLLFLFVVIMQIRILNIDNNDAYKTKTRANYA
jgi:hypothetical protein